MMKKIKNVIWKLLNIIGIDGAVEIFISGQLKESGWFNSFSKKQSIDKHGNPIPWNPYSYIKFIKPRLKKEFNIFEYGSGNSTLWYAHFVKTVISVEHDREWYELIKNKMPVNSEILFSERKNYVSSINTIEKGFHIIIIDGILRNECVEESVHNITQDGVIILDDSNREEYKSSIEFLYSNNFKRIDFWGIGPVVSDCKCTSIFYRNTNCLNI